MKVICKNTNRDFYKVSVNSGRFYEFVNKECEVTDIDDLAFFKNHSGYEVSEEKVKKKKGDE